MSIERRVSDADPEHPMVNYLAQSLDVYVFEGGSKTFKNLRGSYKPPATPLMLSRKNKIARNQANTKHHPG